MIRPATGADIARLSLTAVRAFADDPVWRWLFPDPVDYETAGRAVLASLGRRWLDTDSLWCTDDGVAMAGWIPPGRPEPPPRAEPTANLDPDPKPEPDAGSAAGSGNVTEPSTGRTEHPPWRLERFAALTQAMDDNTPPEPHWYLNLLATHPDWQRQGLGRDLMAVVFARADEHGLACYLETETTENVAYYRHHGFEVRTEWDVPVDGPHMWGMLRPAR